MIDAVIPAHNEESTVHLVVSALLRSGLFGRIIVVDDGSRDGTSVAAARAGAEVLRLETNRGKGGAMLAGVAASDAAAIAFFDADAIALEPAHAELLVSEFARGFTQVCGIQDHGWWGPIAALTQSLITGQRIVQRWVLQKLPPSCGGYSVEVAINDIVDRNGGSTCVVILRGARFRPKAAKVGWVEGRLRDLRMFGEAMRAKAALEATKGTSCDIARKGA